MTVRQLVVDVLLWVGVLLELLSCLGMVVMRSVYDRLHFSGPAVLGLVLIAAAVVVQKSFSLVGDKALLIAAFMILAAPVVTHTIARAARVVQRGEWRLGEDEQFEVHER